ncbi:MAG TPA: hypothetical protein VHQ41_01095 [Patescibacteria group bacterium]|nr:hypothetical protein [Patescibacteria group bacterium]
MPHDSIRHRPNNAERKLQSVEVPLEMDADKIEKTLGTQELQEKAETAVSEFVQNGIPQAEKIAAEFGVEVDEQTRVELERLNIQAKQAEDFFKSSIKNRLLDVRAKVLNKVLPGTRIAELATHTAEFPFRQKLERTLNEYKKSPPENLEDIINTYSNYSNLHNRVSQANVEFPDVLESYLREVKEKHGLDKAIQDYKKVPPELFSYDRNTTLGYWFVQEACNEINDKGLARNREDAIPFILEKFKGMNELVLSGYRAADLPLKKEDILKLLMESSDTPAGKWGILKNIENISSLGQRDYDQLSDKLFDVYLDLDPTRLLLSEKHLQSFNELPEDVRTEKITKMLSNNSHRFATQLRLIDIPDSVRDKIWPIVDKNDFSFKNQFLKNADAFRELGVSNEDAINTTVERNARVGELLEFLQQKDIANYGFSEADKKYAYEKMIASMKPDQLLRIQGMRKCFDDEQIAGVAYKVLSSPIPEPRYLVALASNLDSIQLNSFQKKDLIQKMLSDPNSQGHLVHSLEKFGLSQVENYHIIDTVAPEQAFSELQKLTALQGEVITGEQKKLLRNKLAFQLPQSFLSNFADFNLTEEEEKAIAPILYEGIFVNLGVDRSFQVDMLAATRAKTGERIPFTPETQHRFENLFAQAKPSAFRKYASKLNEAIPVEMDLDNLPINKTYGQLEKLQARSANEDHDPWKTDLDPLVNKAIENKILNLNQPKDGEILVDFVKEYGMNNVPTILEWHAALERSKTLADLPQEIKKQIEKELKIEIGSFENKGQITKEIKKFKGRIQETLLNDEIPEEFLTTEVGKEIFGMLKGNTHWEKNDSLADMIYKWRSFSRRKPELAKVPENYQEVSMSIPALIRRSLNENEEELAQKKENEVLDNPHLIGIIQSLDSAFKGADQIQSTESEEEDKEKFLKRWSELKKDIIEELTQERHSLDLRIQNEPKEQARIGMSKRVEKIAEDIQKVENFEGSANLNEMMEGLIKVVPKKSKNGEAALRQISMKQMMEIDPAAAAGLKENIDFTSDRLTPEKLTAWNTYLVDYINEHYLNSEQVEEHTKHPAFSAELLNELKSLYGLNEDLKKNLVIQLRDKLQSVRNQGVEATTKTIDVSLVPNKGLLRIYGGDIGDACYSSQHKELAEGDYPGITAFTFVTGRGTVNERLRGSLLAIETETSKGENVLLVRANNPQENLLGQVDNDELIKQTLEQMKKLAERRGIEKVVVPLDPASASCSNRKNVASYYRTKFSDAERIALEDMPETNFNGYDVWNPHGSHGVVEI